MNNKNCPYANSKKVYLIGNPNSGKTSLFNVITGEQRKVGNWPGVTVSRIKGFSELKESKIPVFDLPGTYSLTPATPEEAVVTNSLDEIAEGIVLNIVDTGNLERNMFLTTQLIEIGIVPVIALNCFDTFTSSGGTINLQNFQRITGLTPFPTVARTGVGKTALLEKIHSPQILKSEPFKSSLSLPKIWQDSVNSVLQLRKLKWDKASPKQRYDAITELVHSKSEKLSKIQSDLKQQLALVSEAENIDLACELASDRYRRIEKAISICAFTPERSVSTLQQKADSLLINKYLGLPIFALIMAWIFWTTFTLGAVPMQWMQSLVNSISHYLNNALADSMLRGLLVDGIISGVGGVLIFLPNIIILFFWIALLEDSGYMSRAAFLMDRMMNAIGLHGRAFIPMIMGLGCNVPAVMATKTIEDPAQRRLTMLLIPLVPCSARLPLLVLLCGTFFPENPSLWMFILFFFNLAVIFFLSRVSQLISKRSKDAPFLLEMPPYRVPTSKSIFNILYEKGMHFVEKAGTVILAGTVIIWVLSAFPLNKEIAQKYDTQISLLQKQPVTPEIKTKIKALNSEKAAKLMDSRYMAKIGKFIHPVMAPLGFTWRETISLIPGFLAKESVVSTLSVLYKPLSTDLTKAVRIGGMDKLKAFVFMLFTLLYIPCIATVGVIWRESYSAKFAFMGILTYFLIAYGVSYLVLQLCSLLAASGSLSGSSLMDGLLILIIVIISGRYLLKTLWTSISGKSCDSCNGCSSCSQSEKGSCHRDF